MKKTLVSLAAAAALTTGAMAADKGIDIVTTGQSVVYYQTSEADGAANDLFSKAASSANVGVQLNLNADLGNNFTFGSQLSYLGTAGLENNLVGNTRQQSAFGPGSAGSGADILNSTTDQIMLTKIFVAKKIGNTTVKIGRQELPKSLSPLAFTEGWNVFKNTFDAILVVNSDIPDTTIVGAFVGGTTGHDLSSVNSVGTPLNGGAYMLTVQNKSLPMTTVTASYYRVTHAADAMWLDVAVAGKDLPIGLKVGLQGGQINADASGAKATTAFGVKLSAKPVDALTICGAYTSVNDGTSGNIVNQGTNVKTPLFTQMVANQGAIDHDNDTMMLKLALNTGDYGTVILRGSQTADNAAASNDLTEIDLMYKTKLGGATIFAAYVTRDWDNTVDSDIVRVWARYAF